MQPLSYNPKSTIPSFLGAKILPNHFPTIPTWDLLVGITAPGQDYTVDINSGTFPEIHIDWGDGVVENFTSTGQKTHVYQLVRTYKVKISGRFRSGGNIRLGSNVGNRARLKATGVIPLISGLVSFQATFDSCSGLTAIPADLFKYNTAVSTGGFQQTFYNCSGLTAIPVDLFRYNTAVSTSGFQQTFYGCTGLTAIPADLFKYNTAVSTGGFSATFYNCIKLPLAIDTFGQSDEYATRFLDRISYFKETFRISSFAGTQGTAPPLWEYDYENIIELDVSPVTDWVADDVITGQSSAATCVVVSKVNATSYRIKKLFGTFTLGETIGVTGNADKLADQGATRPTFLETLILNVAPATAWVAGDVITGQSSGATCTVVSQYNSTTYTVKLRSATYTLGEIIGVTGTPAKLADQGTANPIFLSVPYALDCFDGHSSSSVSNYADIPASWR